MAQHTSLQDSTRLPPTSSTDRLLLRLLLHLCMFSGAGGLFGAAGAGTAGAPQPAPGAAGFGSPFPGTGTPFGASPFGGAQSNSGLSRSASKPKSKKR
jgi:hypothetical protein